MLHLTIASAHMILLYEALFTAFKLQFLSSAINRILPHWTLGGFRLKLLE